LVFLPHGLDQLLGKSDGPLIPEWKGLIAKAVLSTPTGQQQYLAQMSKLLATAFKVDALQARINELAALIRPAIAERDSAAAKAFDDAVIKLRDQVAKRAYFIEQQLKAQPGSK